MPTAFIEDGYRFKIYPNDHPPPHVHVQKAEHEARVRFDQISIMSNEGFNSRELGKIIELIKEHQETLLAMWALYHGSDEDQK